MFSGWKDRSSLAKAVIVLSAIFTVSLGLCGINSPLISSLHTSEGLSIYIASISFAGMIFSLIGLLIVGIIALFRVIYRIFTHQN